MIWDSNTKLADDTFGFIYVITYDDGMKYVGKKQIVSEVIIPALASGELRPGAIRINRDILRDEKGNIITSKAKRKQARKNGIKAVREQYDKIVKPAKWMDYNGSCENVGDRKIIKKEIVWQAKSKKELTYREMEFMFMTEVLESNEWLNDNIAGTFFREETKLW